MNYLILILIFSLVPNTETPYLESNSIVIFEGSIFTIEVGNLQVDEIYSILVEQDFILTFIASEKTEYIPLAVNDSNNDLKMYVALYDVNLTKLFSISITITQTGGMPTGLLIRLAIPIFIIVFSIGIITAIYRKIKGYLTNERC